MKLLFVLPEYLPMTGGGIATFYLHILPELVRQGHQVDVLVGSAVTAKLPSFVADGVQVEFIDPDVVSANLDRFNHYRAFPELQRHLSAAWTAWEQVQGKTYDLVETTDWGLLFIPWIVETASPPTVVQLHGSIGQIDSYDPRLGEELPGHLIRLLEASLLSSADELQANSQSNAQAWSKLTKREVHYIPPAWLPSLSLKPSSHKSDSGLVVGRIQAWKGPAVLCEALRLLGDAAPTIDWVGRDMPHQASDSMSTHLAQTYPDVWGIKICPLGLRTAKETANLQAHARFLIVPSIWDVFNYTCVEGMGYGQVVLCSQGAGAASLIADKINGLTFNADEPVALANSLEYFVSMSDRACQEMGELAQQTVHTTLDPRRIVQARIEAYQSLVQKGKFSARPHAWLVDAVSPHTPNVSKPLAFLDRLPLKEIASYTLHRSFKKALR